MASICASKKGRILGLIGPNGAGKTTALNAILGLTPYQGELRVLGRDPWTERDQLMRDVSFIADVAVLPRWIRVSQALDYVAGVHPQFDRAKAEGFLARTTIKHTKRSGNVQGHGGATAPRPDDGHRRAITGARRADARPGHSVSQAVLRFTAQRYFDRTRTIIVTTHQVEEIQDVLTDLMFIDRGRIVLELQHGGLRIALCRSDGASRTCAGARALKPMHERQVFGRSILLFDRVDRGQLAALGDVRTPSIADLFVAVMAPAIQARRKPRLINEEPSR